MTNKELKASNIEIAEFLLEIVKARNVRRPGAVSLKAIQKRANLGLAVARRIRDFLLEEEWIKEVKKDRFTLTEETDKELIQDSKLAKIWDHCRSKAVDERLSEGATKDLKESFPEADIEAGLEELVSMQYLKKEGGGYALLDLDVFEIQYLELILKSKKIFVKSSRPLPS